MKKLTQTFDRIYGSMEITTTIGCKNACIYCPQEIFVNEYNQGVKNNEKEMSLENFKLYLNKIPPHVQITFSGMSEPSQNKYFTNMIEFAHNMGYPIRVNTTATGLSERDIERLAGIPFTIFAVHLPDESDHFTNIPCDEEHLNTIKMLERSRIQNLQFRVIGKPHPRFQKALKSFIRESRVFYRVGNLQHLDAKYFKLKKNNFHPVKNRLKGKIWCARTKGKKLNRNILLPSGDVLLCCMDYGMKHVIGNLKTMSYFSLYESDEYKRVKKGLNEESDVICRYCEAAISVNKTSILH